MSKENFAIHYNSTETTGIFIIFTWEINPKGPHLFIITNTWETRVQEMCNNGIVLGSLVKSVSFWRDLGSYFSSNRKLNRFHRKEMKCWQVCDRPSALSVCVMPFDLILTAGISGMAIYVESKKKSFLWESICLICHICFYLRQWMWFKFKVV